MYHTDGNNVWALIYGETYLTKSNDSLLANQVKKMVIDAYRAILTGGSNTQLPTFGGTNQTITTTRTFESAYIKVLTDNAAAVSMGF